MRRSPWITLTALALAGSASAAPVRVQPGEVAAVIIIAILLSLGAAAYPAWRSARVEPVEGLRHE